jgi:hypothetical protein
MRLLLLFFFLGVGMSCAQQVDAVFISKQALVANRFAGADDFGNLYYVKDAVFCKQDAQKTLVYNNLSLGAIGAVDLLNPLEITLFYPDTNTAVKLDNTLNEMLQINFNQARVFRNIRYATTANDKNLWIFNADLNQLELFNYQTQEGMSIQQPLDEMVIAQVSDYNFCWLLTEQRLLQYNAYGALLATIPLKGYEALAKDGNYLLLKKNNNLFFLQDGKGQPVRLELPEIIVKDFSLTGENVYLYDGKNLYHYHLIIREKN